MVEMATRTVADDRLSFALATAEHLPYPDNHFDLVVSTTSFDHWSNQAAGLGECARVLRSGGQVVLVDRFSAWLLPTHLAAGGARPGLSSAATGCSKVPDLARFPGTISTPSSSTP